MVCVLKNDGAATRNPLESDESDHQPHGGSISKPGGKPDKRKVSVTCSFAKWHLCQMKGQFSTLSNNFPTNSPTFAQSLEHFGALILSKKTPLGW